MLKNKAKSEYLLKTRLNSSKTTFRKEDLLNDLVRIIIHFSLDTPH